MGNLILASASSTTARTTIHSDPLRQAALQRQYLCFDPRRPGYVVGMWTDRWIMLNHEMVFDAKVQRAARDCLVPCLLLPNGEPDDRSTKQSPLKQASRRA